MTTKGRFYPQRTLAVKDKWTEEETTKLITLVQEYTKPNGQVQDGFYSIAATILCKSEGAVRRFKSRLVTLGRIKKSSERACINEVFITDVEAAWLAGILDGEGCIRLKYYGKKWKDREYQNRQVQVVLAYNTDMGILDKIKRLIPFVHTHGPYRSHMSTKDLYYLHLTRRRDIYIVLNRLLPFMANTDKLFRGTELIRIIEEEAKIGKWLTMTSLQ